jgi:hypothetical protein
MEKKHDADKKAVAVALWRLRAEYAEIEALRAAAAGLRFFREKFAVVDVRFD